MKAQPKPWAVRLRRAARRTARWFLFCCFLGFVAALFFPYGLRFLLALAVTGIGVAGMMAASCAWLAAQVFGYMRFSLGSLLLWMLGLGLCGSLLVALPGAWKWSGGVGLIVMAVLLIREIIRQDSERWRSPLQFLFDLPPELEAPPEPSAKHPTNRERSS